MTRFLLVAALAVGVASVAHAQRVAVVGEVRHRTEFDDRDLSGTADATVYHRLRTRLGIDARPAPRLRVFAQVQDARLWGGEDPALGLGTLDGSADQLDLHQAFVDLDSLGGQPLALRLGRQELAYGNERLVGAVGWSNTGRSFDAVRLRWQRGPVLADVVAAQLVTSLGPTAPQALVGTFGAWTVPGRTVEAFAFADLDDARIDAGPDAGDRRRERVSVGSRAAATFGRVGFEGEVIGQFGAAAGETGAPRDAIRAWLGSVEAGVQTGPVRLAVGATRLSGDSDPADGVDHRFDTLFATNHTFYGAMDFFPRFAGAAGLDDLYLSAAGLASRRWTLRAAGHAFWSAADRGDGRPLGQEIDLGARYALATVASVEAGVSAFRAADRFADREITTCAYLVATVGF